MIGKVIGVVVLVDGEKIPRFFIDPLSRWEVQVGARVGFDLGIGRNVHNLRVDIKDEMDGSVGAIRSDKED